VPRVMPFPPPDQGPQVSGLYGTRHLSIIPLKIQYTVSKSGKNSPCVSGLI
jgi:hypothetical protein